VSLPSTASLITIVIICVFELASNHYALRSTFTLAFNMHSTAAFLNYSSNITSNWLLIPALILLFETPNIYRFCVAAYRLTTFLLALSLNINAF
jgi:hypothetical protein